MKKMLKEWMFSIIISVGERYGELALNQCCFGRFHEPKIPEALLRDNFGESKD